LNGAGLRFDFGKTQGLFNKIARPKGYLLIWTVGSRSDDSDTFQLRWSNLHGEGPDMLRLTEGLNGSEERRKLVGDEGRAAETGGARWKSCCRGLLGF
jgi:hypothetical protein